MKSPLLALVLLAAFVAPAPAHCRLFHRDCHATASHCSADCHCGGNCGCSNCDCGPIRKLLAPRCCKDGKCELKHKTDDTPAVPPLAVEAAPKSKPINTDLDLDKALKANKHNTLTIQKNETGRWYWVLTAGNGWEICRSSYAYKSLEGLKRSIERRDETPLEIKVLK